MTVMLAQVSFPYDTALPEDVSVNTFHFEGDSVLQEWQDIVTALSSFYTGANTTATIASRLSTHLVSPATVKIYDLADPTPRVPKHTGTFAFTPGAAALPEEVAVCLSYQAAKVSGLDQRNRRGRIYIGPLANATGVVGTGGAGNRPVAAFLTDIGVAATRLATASFGAGCPWVVYSPTLGSAAMITDGWIDNAFDTQRRRGVRTTSRTLWT